MPETFSRITEKSSDYHSLDQMSLNEIVTSINQEDSKTVEAVNRAIPSIEKLIEQILPRFKQGGRLFYIGAGTSGRLGILDASEIPPTYGLPHNRVVGLIAGGDKAIRKSVEFAEDNPDLAKVDLQEYTITALDSVIGIASSGTTPYVLGGLEYAREKGAFTGAITNNHNTPLADRAHITIELIVGPEFVTGSTRMKGGTSQKMVLNMISTALMIKTKRVKGNKMVHMQLNNKKLVERGVNFLVEELKISTREAQKLLNKYGSVKEAISHHAKSSS
jgi:N-acetylmuramic acid 6-phosphate etherase